MAKHAQYALLHYAAQLAQQLEDAGLPQALINDGTDPGPDRMLFSWRGHVLDLNASGDVEWEVWPPDDGTLNDPVEGDGPGDIKTGLLRVGDPLPTVLTDAIRATPNEQLTESDS